MVRMKSGETVLVLRALIAGGVLAMALWGLVACATTTTTPVSRQAGPAFAQMKTKILSTMAVVAMMWGAGAARDSLAQTPSEMPEHASPGHRMNGPSDGAFHHRFEDAEKWAKEFDNPERDTWQKPEEILDALHLQRTSLVADIGAGTGYFSVRIAKRIPEGKIFAADIEPDMVRYLGERARREHLINLVPVQASADAVNLPEPVDVALVVDTYHHIGMSNRTQLRPPVSRARTTPLTEPRPSAMSPICFA
jgi:hypothetical protein